MNIEILVAEIGSTTTEVAAFTALENPEKDRSGERPRYLGQGVAPTSVYEGDVRIGLDAAVEQLRQTLGADQLTWNRFFATSSAAGGLRMTVHGLAYDMTVRAGREAALGAGANLHHITAGRLRKSDLRRVREIRPNIILLAGGVDYGERDTALYNAEALRDLLDREELDIPVVYAGNVENHEEVRELFARHEGRLYLTENVYPRIDELNIEPTRAIIHEVFERHITGGPGMQHIRDRVDGPVRPTPGAVLEAAKLLRERIGDLLVIDVGGATTDVHSVTDGSEEVRRILIAPEPQAKRTVEGDLGTYVNRRNILSEKELDRSAERLGMDREQFSAAVEELPPIPRSPQELALAEELTYQAAFKALVRHAGKYRSLYGPEGKKNVAEGKDLTGVRYALATGGALTKLPGRERVYREALSRLPGNTLSPPNNVELGFDNHYIMAAAGVLGTAYPETAAALLQESLWPDPRHS